MDDVFAAEVVDASDDEFSFEDLVPDSTDGFETVDVKPCTVLDFDVFVGGDLVGFVSEATDGFVGEVTDDFVDEATDDFVDETTDEFVDEATKDFLGEGALSGSALSGLSFCLPSDLTRVNRLPSVSLFLAASA